MALNKGGEEALVGPFLPALPGETCPLIETLMIETLMIETLMIETLIIETLMIETSLALVGLRFRHPNAP
ncbi:unnamed protein product [Clonostachys rhizophaga]|uniref:Uncharacterized protein n=1 Tax=Clonostachys rhizophaga TaxID=160324 RepID=A0A9N9YFK5_9HYPO|nr:unnamed protein product [Clonostachys rhizophaga]